jgi:hypothetical protein
MSGAPLLVEGGVLMDVGARRRPLSRVEGGTEAAELIFSMF